MIGVGASAILALVVVSLVVRSASDENVASGTIEAQTTTQPSTTSTTHVTTTTTTAAPDTAPPVVMVAVGDIACDPDDDRFEDGNGTDDACHQMHTSDVALTVDPDFVAVLGDLQYANGELEDFYRSYDPFWGRLLDVTYSTPGNHDYYSDDGTAGYFTYFGERAGIPGQGYYSYDAGAWHVVVLNTMFDEAGGCEVDSPQGLWLAADLSDNAVACTLAYGHYPRFPSGGHGDGGSYDSTTTEHAEKNLFWHDYVIPGNFTPTVTVTDDVGMTATASCSFTYSWTGSPARDPLRGARQQVPQ